MSRVLMDTLQGLRGAVTITEEGGVYLVNMVDVPCSEVSAATLDDARTIAGNWMEIHDEH